MKIKSAVIAKKLFPKNIMSTPFKDKTKMGKYCNPCYITKKEKNTIINQINIVIRNKIRKEIIKEIQFITQLILVIRNIIGKEIIKEIQFITQLIAQFIIK
jgi:hypothetical protein